MTDDQLRPSWTIRRRIILATLIFCAAIVVYLLHKGDDTELARTALASAFTLAGGVIGAYVFGAVWDDSRRHVTHVPPPQP